MSVHRPESDLVACWKAVKAAVCDERLAASDIACLVVILDRFNDAGTAWPSLGRIAADAAVNRATAVRSIKRLVSLGYLERESGTRTTSNRYRLGGCADAPRCSDAPRCVDAPGVGAAVRLQVGAAMRLEPTSLNLPKEPTQEAETAPRPRAPSGSRLPDDWQPSHQDIEFAERARPDVDWRAEAEKFRDYWHGVAGAKGRKADWPATWRNWIRRADGTRGRNGQVQHSKTTLGLAGLLGVHPDELVNPPVRRRGELIDVQDTNPPQTHRMLPWSD